VHERSRVVKFCGRLTCRAWFDFTETDRVGLAAAFLCVYREFIKFCVIVREAINAAKMSPGLNIWSGEEGSKLRE
jgi:hypothetical protein